MNESGDSFIIDTLANVKENTLKHFITSETKKKKKKKKPSINGIVLRNIIIRKERKLFYEIFIKFKKYTEQRAATLTGSAHPRDPAHPQPWVQRVPIDVVECSWDRWDTYRATCPGSGERLGQMPPSRRLRVESKHRRQKSDLGSKRATLGTSSSRRNAAPFHVARTLTPVINPSARSHYGNCSNCSCNSLWMKHFMEAFSRIDVTDVRRKLKQYNKKSLGTFKRHIFERKIYLEFN
ncbi:hypothetical protein PUN28_001410 [Cardiocondyla obscurior]|uniref:Uncharacterized protein n=1 Tax=Cardiocondyla obscurior TaxID=286306 RepID=A0AAW2H4W2_9HYME